MADKARVPQMDLQPGARGEEAKGSGGPATTRSGSRNLILLRAGDTSLHATWLGHSASERKWDMHISYFGSKGLPAPIDSGISVSFDHQTNKWPGVAAALESRQFSLDDYAYVALPDDDLISTVDDWNRAFELARQYNLGACQLSLDYASFVGYLDTVKRPSLRLRFVSIVEFMAPIVRVDVLRKLIPYLTMDNNVWAIDVVAQHLLSEQPRSMAVLDEVSVLHTRAFMTGPLYEHMHEAALHPHDALQMFLKQNGITYGPRTTFSAITRDGREIKRWRVAELFVYYSRLLNWYRRGRGHLRIATAEDGQVVLLRKYWGAPPLPVDRRRVVKIRAGEGSGWTPEFVSRFVADRLGARRSGH